MAGIKKGMHIPGVNFLGHTDEALKAFDNFVVEEKVSVVHTTIENRTPVSATLKCLGPVERIKFEDIVIVDSEIGPAGEKVYQLSGGEEARVRFVGHLWKTQKDTDGTHITADKDLIPLIGALTATWSSAGAMSSVREGLGGAGTQSAAMAIGGSNDGGSRLSSTEKYGGTSWSAGANVSQPKKSLAAAGLQNATVIFGGSISGGTKIKVTELYSGAAWSTSGELSVARSGLGGVGSQAAALAFGGFDTTYSTLVEKFNGTVWSTTGPLLTARYGLAGAGTTLAAVAFGGETGAYSAVTELFNGTIWATSGSLPVATASLAGAGIHNKAVAFGGATAYSGGTYTVVDSTLLFNGTVWSTTGGSGLSRHLHAAAGDQSSAAVFGGHNGSMDVFDLTQNFTLARVLNDFAEVNFYGTGLNLNTLLKNDTRNFAVTIDNGTETPSLFGSNSSDILTGKSYAVNNIVNVAKGLTEGWHTVRLRVQDADVSLYGVEILNESTTLKTLPGEGFSGVLQDKLAAATTTAFNAGVTGTKGARVIKYLKDGEVTQAVTMVDATAKFNTTATHTNEEIDKSYYFKEFGVSGVSGFSALTTTANVAYTLDDNATTLVGKSVHASAGHYVTIDATGGYVAIGFIGSGLDLRLYDFRGDEDKHQVAVDGVDKYLLENLTGAHLEICSGLPYQFHWVTITRIESVSASLQFQNFIVYRPKAPTPPVDAIKLADYCVMANYAATAVTNSIHAMSNGMIAKAPMREFNYKGTTVIAGGAANPDAPFGWVMEPAMTSYAELEFYGTGVELIVKAATDSDSNVSVSIDGSSNLTGYTTLLRTPAGVTGCSITAANGVWDTKTTAGTDNSQILAITGIPLGLHKVRITSGSATLRFEGAYIIAPIYFNDSNIGSLSLKNVVSYTPTQQGSTGSGSGISDTQKLHYDAAYSHSLTAHAPVTPTFSFDVILPNETLTIPERQQMAVHNGLQNDGELIVLGTLILV